MQRKNSKILFEEAKQYFPGGVHSPVRAFKAVNGPPAFIKKGESCYLIDEDDHKYIDFCGSWGPLILGHAHPRIIASITATLQNGTSFGAPSALGNEMGKLIIENNRFIEQIRFVSSGTEAVMSAIRLARGFTGKTKVLKFEGCYHGHVDSLLVKAGSGLATFGVSTSAGIPESFVADTIILNLNDLEKLELTLREHQQEIACVIIEPIPANNGLLLQDTNYLVWLRKLCDDYKVLLIFDEVISGFRVGFEGAAGYYNIAPDIITYGKIIGGGLPVGAYASSKEIMSTVAPLGPVYQAGTLSANPVAMSAGIATLKLLLEEGFYTELAQKTDKFVGQINDYLITKNYKAKVVNIGSIFWISFSQNRVFSSDQIDSRANEYFKIMHEQLLDNGVYLGPSAYEVGFISIAHEEDVLIKAASIICDSFDHIFSQKSI